MNIKALLAQKSAMEQSCKRKNWVWEKTSEEHSALEAIDAKLIALGYYSLELNKWQDKVEQPVQLLVPVEA